MKKYHKIQSVFMRDPETKFKTFLNDYSTPEIEYLANNNWSWTEKIDGTNIRIGWTPSESGQVSIGGRTDNAQIPTFLLSRLYELVDLSLMSSVFDCPVTLYGEGYGAKIQKGGGGYIPDGVDFVLFDVMINDTWLARENVEDIAKKLGIKYVPIRAFGTIADAESLVKRGFKSDFGDRDAEGLVLRPLEELMDRRGHRIITKLKTKDYQ